jgi:ribosomal protein S18 acetylase RimI-like enzyme
MIKIKKMLPEYRGKVYEILQQTDFFTPAEIDVAMELIDIYLFNKSQTDYCISVAMDEENEVVGYFCYGPTPAAEGTFDLYWIAVSPTVQNRGIGKKLLNYVENEVERKGGRMIIIETSSQDKYGSTQQFYFRNNCVLEARIKDFYRVGDDRLIFVKRLGVSPNGGTSGNGTVAEESTKKLY